MFRDVPQILVIRHDLHDLDARQLAGVVPQQELPEAVGVLGHLRAVAFVARQYPGLLRKVARVEPAVLQSAPFANELHGMHAPRCLARSIWSR